MGSPYDLLSSHDDNYVRVKQATKQGYILCPWGGGRPLISDLKIKAWKGTREWSDLPYTYGWKS
jgi:hypothetical protein